MDDQTPDLRQTLGVLWRHKVLIAGIAIVGALGAYYLSAGQTPVYESSARIVLRPVVTSAAFGGFGNSDPLGLKLAPESEAEILTSPIIGQRVKDELKLQDPADVLAASIQVRILTDELMLVSASAFTPARAAELANGFAEEYLAYRRELANDSLRAHINDLEQRTKAILKRVNALDKDIIKLSAQSGAIRANDELSSRDTARLAQYQAEIDRFTAERNELLGDLASLRSRHEDARASQLGTGGGGEVVQPAIEPAASVSPKPKRDAAVGMVLGLLVALALVAVLRLIDDRIRSEWEAARATGVRMVPSIPRGPRAMRKTGAEGLVSLSHPMSAAAEGYRSLRESLLQLGLGSGATTLLITSGGPGAGKTTIASNLGVVMAQAGMSVVLVSADLRAPNIHALFSIDDQLGLSTVLADGRDPLEFIVETPIEGLRVLPSGPLPANPAGLLDRHRMSRVMAALSKTADVIIVDAPPLSSGADAAVLASCIDLSLLVLRWGVAREGGASAAVNSLAAAGAARILAVLNCATGSINNAVSRPPWPGTMARTEAPLAVALQSPYGAPVAASQAVNGAARRRTVGSSAARKKE